MKRFLISALFVLYIPNHIVAQSDFTSVSFANDSVGWICGYEGTILKTNNSGTYWISQPTGTASNLNSIYFIDDNNGWSVGEDGIILHTNDGGATWSQQTSGTNVILNDVHFLASYSGWIVGRSGLILNTTNGGLTWSSQNAGISEIFHTVYFADQNNGWVAGNDGATLSTTNGGTNWVQQNSGFDKAFLSIFFVDSQSGWAVGRNGQINFTVDGGVTWVPQSSGVTATLNSIYMLDSSTGWIASNLGYIFKTTDGGNSWAPETSGTTENLFSTHFVDSIKGWAVGANETILKTNDGGNTWIKQMPSWIGPDWYVSETMGNDSTGDGSQTYPFLTVRRALDEINALNLGHQDTILISGKPPDQGNYNLSNPINIHFMPLDQDTAYIEFSALSSNAGFLYFEDVAFDNEIYIYLGSTYLNINKCLFKDGVWFRGGVGIVQNSIIYGYYYLSKGANNLVTRGNTINGNLYVEVGSLKVTIEGNEINGNVMFHPDSKRSPLKKDEFNAEVILIKNELRGNLMLNLLGYSTINIIEVNNNIIKGNLFSYDVSSLSVINNTIIGRLKTAPNNPMDKNLTIKNNIIYSDSGGFGIDAPDCNSYSNFIVEWNNLYGFDTLVTCLDTAGLHLTNFNPYFADSLYHLYDISPARDAGDPDPSYNDVDGTRNDLGAYGGPGGESYPYPQDTTDGLLAYYPFNSNANDESGNGNHGTVIGAISTHDRFGNPNSAYSFDGLDDYISISNYQNFNNMNSFSLTAWVYPTNISNHGCIISKTDPGRDFDFKLWNGLLSLEIYDGQYYVCRMDSIMQLNTWSFVTAIWTGNDFNIYLNGNLIKSCPHPGVSPPWTGTMLQIGRLSEIEYFTGNIDEVRLYNRVLSQSEIQELYIMPEEFVVGEVSCSTEVSQSCPVTAEINIDMTNVLSPDTLLGSFTATLEWNPTELEFISHSGILQGFTGVVNTNQADSGLIIFNGANPFGASGIVNVLNIDFNAIGSVGIGALLNLEFSSMGSAYTFRDLLPILTVNDDSLTITEEYLGDVNCDGQANSTDALIILSYDAQLPISDPCTIERLNEGFGDVNSDLNTNSLDALIIISYDVGIPVPFPVGNIFCP